MAMDVARAANCCGVISENGSKKGETVPWKTDPPLTSARRVISAPQDLMTRKEKGSLGVGP